MHLIPKVKHLEIRSGFLENKSIFIATQPIDSRLIAVVDMLPVDPKGTPLELIVDEGHGEAYELTIEERKICIHANGQAGAFYAFQTLRQIFEECNVPCLYIKDWPDFPYRGFYQDVTRGKIASVETIKQLIDRMAYYKLNSLQLYVEHVFEFEETKGLWDKTGYLTKAELQEIGTYCHDNFIEFIPSLATFGHMHDILEQEQYRYLRVNQDDLIPANLWLARMNHHTINPFFPESIELVKSLIDQYGMVFGAEKSWSVNTTLDDHFYAAVNWYYKLSQDTDYIRRYRIAKAMHWKTKTQYAEIRKEEVGQVFAKVLEHAGVYKCTEEGKAALPRFVAYVN